MQELAVKRHEEKYLLNPAQALELQIMLDALLQRDRYSRKGAYYIRSLYFDTPDDQDYLDKVLGVKRRQKIRLRLYDLAAPTLKLEIKNKQGSYSYKQGVTVDRTAAQALIDGDAAPLLALGSPTAVRAYGFFQRELRRPTALVDYERLAFWLPVEDLRITLDTHVRAAKSDRIFSDQVPMVGLHGGGTVILEVKYNRYLPHFLRGPLSTLQTQATSVSKYAAARGMLY